MENNNKNQNLYEVLFIQEDESKKSLFGVQTIINYVQRSTASISAKNHQLIIATQMLCNVLVVLIFGSDIYYIGQVKAINGNKICILNGVNFQKFTIQKMIKECIDKKLKEYLKRIGQKKFDFKKEEKQQFVQLCCSIKNFPNLFIKSIPIPILYQSDKNEIIKIDSPIIKLIPDLIQLEEANPINQDYLVSTNSNIYKRVIRQIIAVNEDFHSLRTVVTPSINRQINVFNFVMYPNDGAFCSLPLIGRIIIPQTYPTNPPVFHLFTKTNRANLDVFNYAAISNNMNSSSICFDIVKPTSMRESTWKTNYTLSTVFASIMGAIVSFKVPQMYGGQRQQAVTMQALKSSMNNVQQEIYNRWNQITKLPKIPIVKACRLMCNQMKFKILQKWDDYFFYKSVQNIISEPIRLQKDCWTAQFQLNNLSAEYVLSFILTNNINDIKGEHEETVIFRNGVTATAAQKLRKRKLNWFYHGKPLNNGDMRLNITVTSKQFVFSYNDASTQGEWIIHGDNPVNILTKKTVGQLSHQDFYLVIFVRNKNRNLKGNFSMRQIFTNVGYIHKSCQQRE